MKQKISFYGLASIALGMVITALLFRESFSGLVLQGVDDNISMRMMMLRSLESGQGFHFFPVYWLGYVFNVPNPDLYTTVLALTQSNRVVWVFASALIISMGVTYGFLRKLDIRKDAALFGALSYSLIPHVFSLVFSGHAPAISAIPMTPGFLWALTVICKDKELWKKVLAACWAGIFWSQMILGEPQRAIYGSVLGVAWVLYLLFQNGTFSFKGTFIKADFWKKFLPFFALAALIGAIVYFPAYRFWSTSEFASQEGSWEFSTSWSFPPSELIDSLAFGYHGLATGDAEAPYWGDKPLSGNSDSLGFFLIIFMILGACLLFKKNGKRPQMLFFLIAGFVALLLSFGKYFPGTPFFWLWYHLPGMNKLRVPAKFLSIVALCWTVVASMGFQALWELWDDKSEALKKTKNYVIYGLGAALGLSMLWLTLYFMTQGGDDTAIRAVLGQSRTAVNAAVTMRLNAVINMTLLFMGLFAVVVASHQKWINVRIASFVIIVLASLNLYQSNRPYVAKTYVDEASVYPKTPLISYLLETQTPLQRISGSFFVPNMQNNPEWPMGAVYEQGLYGLNNYDLTYGFPYYDIRSFGRIPVSRLDDAYKGFFKAPVDSVPAYTQNADIWEMNKKLWFMANVDRILVDGQLLEVFAPQLAQDAELLTNVQGLQGMVSVYRLKLSYPRFAMVKGVKSTTDLIPTSMMAQNLQNLAMYQPIAQDNGILLTSSDATVYTPLVEQTGFNSYIVRPQNLTEDRMLIFGELYDEGWQAIIDGVPADITRVNAVQQGFRVPANSQEIEIFYHRPVVGLLVARLVIVLGILAAIAAFIYGLKTNSSLPEESPQPAPVQAEPAPTKNNNRKKSKK
ncbi:MAG: hypothetical protein ACRCY4_03205 [Brevinema sp.]